MDLTTSIRDSAWLVSMETAREKAKLGEEQQTIMRHIITTSNSAVYTEFYFKSEKPYDKIQLVAAVHEGRYYKLGPEKVIAEFNVDNTNFGIIAYSTSSIISHM